MIVNDLDLGGDHPAPSPTVGQVVGTAFVTGSRTLVYPGGAQSETQDLIFFCTAWQPLGGAAAMSMDALRYRLRQLEQLASNPDLQPVYIQFGRTAQAGEYNQDTRQDGWYVIEVLQIDYERFEPAGWAQVRMTVKQVAPAAPASLAARYDGAALATNYSATATPLIGFPINSLPAAVTTARNGAEGAIAISLPPLAGTINPVPFQRPGSIAALYTGQCRVYDTINTVSNPVPLAGGFVHANWVEVKGMQHDFVGDCVVTNGLLLMLYQVGTTAIPLLYLWNTSLGTPAWQSMCNVSCQGDGGAFATLVLREINLERVGLEEVRLRLVANSTDVQWAQFRHKLQRGRYDVYCELTPLTQNQTNQAALFLAFTAAYATIFNDTASATVFPASLATTTVSGYSAGQGSAAGSPIAGFLYQNIPATAQGKAYDASNFGHGDAAGPTQNSFKRYGFFAVPYAGAVVLATARGIVAPLFQQFLFDRTVNWVRG